jgi:hypothetical protein
MAIRKIQKNAKKVFFRQSRNVSAKKIWGLRSSDTIK